MTDPWKQLYGTGWWRRLNYRAADWLYPKLYPFWKFLPRRLQVWFFLNCDLIN